MAEMMKLTLALSGEGELLRYENGGRCAASLCYDGSRAELALYYDFRDEPLHLAAAARPGDRLTVVLLPWRVELWVEDRLADEEWPCGEPLLCGAEQTLGQPCPLQPHVPQTQEQPSVLGSFTGAEGWMPGEGVFVGDCMPYCDGERYHVLYLKDRRHHRSKWGLGAHQWEHISTADGIHWQIHPMAVEIDDPAEGSICTGSWIAHEGMQYLYYTVRTCDGSPASIRRSVSRDGYHFTKDPAFSVLLSDRYTGASARDPKVILGEDGQFHMFLTTSLAKEKVGCLAHLVSAELTAWRELEPIYISATADEPECSDYFSVDGWHYLVYSLRGEGLYLFSREPFTGWQQPADPVIPCESVPKAALWRGRILFAGFIRQQGYGGTLTLQQAHAGPDGILRFSPPAF